MVEYVQEAYSLHRQAVDDRDMRRLSRLWCELTGQERRQVSGLIKELDQLKESS